MNRFTSTALLAAIAALMVSTPASAERVPVEAEPVDLPDVICGFALHMEPVTSNAYAVHTIVNPDGSVTQQVAGAIKYDVTNLDTGKTVRINASGPGRQTAYPDGSFEIQGSGPWPVLFGPITQAQLGLPGLVLTSGRFAFFYDASTNATSFTAHGRLTDVCAMLA